MSALTGMPSSQIGRSRPGEPASPTPAMSPVPDEAAPALKVGSNAITAGMASSVPVPRGTWPAHTWQPSCHTSKPQTPLVRPSGPLKFHKRIAAGFGRLDGMLRVSSNGSKPPSVRRHGVAAHMSFSCVSFPLPSRSLLRVVEPPCVLCTASAAGGIRRTSEDMSSASMCDSPHCLGWPQFERMRRHMPGPSRLPPGPTLAPTICAGAASGFASDVKRR
mmetsp:Transcript_31990/g.91782  ORF Transcript_31990/g.91782 Transcript_31990/m.91782 type:complete len:219 (-) Transcript_31990:1373-2029(-)